MQTRDDAGTAGAWGARYAELYDRFYADKAYDTEVAFLAERARAAGLSDRLRVLDVACGTGRHAQHLVARGHNVVGVDLSAPMLAIAKDRVPSAQFLAQDMTSLDVAPAGFDLAVCLFDALGYCATASGVVAALRAMQRHLRPGGLVVVETWHGTAMLREGSPVRIRRLKLDDAEIVRVSESSVDVSTQTATVNYTVWEHRADGTFSAFEESHVVRYFFADELRLLLELAGFTNVQVHAGYSLNSVDGGTWHLVAQGSVP